MRKLTPPGKWTQVGIVENVHSTRFKRKFCKPVTESDSKTTPEKGLVSFRDGDDWDGNDILNLKTPGVKKISMVQINKFPQKLRGTNTFKMKVVAFYVSVLHVYWNMVGEDIE